ncbi:GGDEF domain-containing protein [Actinoplanes utahensis]|uniref:GGDEF domain-containing protein n=1 Tax=Actinoplanes utahensis TaxID=1869 RepID=UPI00068D9B61|nr:GGDEF domain-containing protein [Actinoplanes utahensis]GIF32059.1 hypothetical protein Aut01nite_50450 [Actinoplanes utahensis]
MRTLLIRRGAAPVDDDALLKRRRTIETASLISRSLGMVFTGMAVAGDGMASAGGLRAACYAGIAAMAVANVFSLVSRRKPGAQWYKRLSAAQVTLDTATMLGTVVLASGVGATAAWPLFALAVAVAALRHQLLGAMLVFIATSLGFALLVPDSHDLTFVAGVNFMIAIITGTQSSSLDRHLKDLNRTRRALQHQATHDGLTGLPNRAQLATYADERAGRPLGVLLLDLNGFKQVNDTYGHAAGDRLLHEVGARLTAVLGPDELAGRIGGDEFLVLLPETAADALDPVADRIRAAVRRPIDIGGREVTVGVSVGTAHREAGSGATLDTLSAEADAGMYRDKRGRSVAA